MLATHIDVERRYDEIRKLTINAAQQKLKLRPEYVHILLKTVDSSALAASKIWGASTYRRVNWNWIEGYSAFKFRYPKRFELAIWHKGTLASLALGRPTYNGSALRLDFIEANPENSEDVKVFPISLFVMMTYAEVLGATELRVMKPVNETVKQYYEATGLIYVSKGDYLYMRL